MPSAYNDFYVGDDCDVTIVAGCGIHNSGDSDSRHDGLHSFYIGKNSHVKYVEKHYGSGDGTGGRIDVDALPVFLGDDVDMGGGGALYACAVGPDVVGSGGHLVEPGHLFQQVFLYLIHRMSSFLFMAPDAGRDDWISYASLPGGRLSLVELAPFS